MKLMKQTISVEKKKERKKEDRIELPADANK